VINRWQWTCWGRRPHFPVEGQWTGAGTKILSLCCPRWQVWSVCQSLEPVQVIITSYYCYTYLLGLDCSLPGTVLATRWRYQFAWCRWSRERHWSPRTSCSWDTARLVAAAKNSSVQSAVLRNSKQLVIARPRRRRALIVQLYSPGGADVHRGGICVPPTVIYPVSPKTSTFLFFE